MVCIGGRNMLHGVWESWGGAGETERYPRASGGDSVLVPQPRSRLDVTFTLSVESSSCVLTLQLAVCTCRPVVFRSAFWLDVHCSFWMLRGVVHGIVLVEGLKHESCKINEWKLD